MKPNQNNMQTLKTCLAAALFVGAVLANAGASDVKLAWDASATPGVTNYVLYAHTNLLSVTNLPAASVRLPVGTNLTATVEGLREGVWSFAAAAMKDGIESEPSNVVTVEVPRPPERMRTVVVQYSGTLTNFYDVGFFRLRLP